MTLRRTLLGTSLLCFAAPALAGPSYPSYTPDLEPANPVAGECYARVKLPAQYDTVTETIVTQEAHSKIHVQQAELASRTEQVMVKEPSVRYVVRQPRYTSVTEQVVTRPAYDKLSVTRPTFQTVTETLQTSAPRLVWKLGNPGKLAAQGYKIHSTADGGYRGQGYSSTTHYGAQGGERCGEMCEIWCLVEEPGDTVTVSRKVMTSPGEVRRTRIPHQLQTITKQVVADPGGVDKIPVPAEYRSITVQDIVRPAAEALVEVPAEYGQIEKKRLVAEERYEWRRVVCAPGTSVGGVTSYSSGGHSTGGAYVSGNRITATHGSTYSSGSYATSGSTYSTGTTHSSTHSSTHSTGRVVTGTGYYGVDDVDTGYSQSSAYPSPTYSGPAYKSDRHTPVRRRR